MLMGVLLNISKGEGSEKLNSAFVVPWGAGD